DLFEGHHENSVANPRRVLAPRRLEGDFPPIRAHDRVGSLEARVLAPPGYAGEVLAVRFQLQFPDIDEVRVLLPLLAAGFDQRVLPVRKDSFDLVVLAGEL